MAGVCFEVDMANFGGCGGDSAVVNGRMIEGET